MGFSLHFMRIHDDELVDADRAAVAAFLAERGLTVVGERPWHAVVDAAGDPLTFDGSITDLRIDPLDSEEALGGGIDHATLSASESAFIFDLCVAAGWLIVDPQDSSFVVPAGNHQPEHLPEDMPVRFVSDVEEMVRALDGSFDDFVAYRDRVLGSQD